MKSRRAPLLLLAGAYFLAHLALVVHPYEHDALPDGDHRCAVCDSLAATNGVAGPAVADTARPVPVEQEAPRLVCLVSRDCPSPYAARAPPSL